MARRRAGLSDAVLDDLDADEFAAPMLLTVHEQQPALSTAGSALLALASMLLVPALLSVAQLAARTSPRWAYAGAILMTLGLTARLFYHGVDATAYDLVERFGSEAAAPLVLNGYGELAGSLWGIPLAASAGTILGSLALGIGALTSGIWGVGRCLLLQPAGWLAMGVLKEHEPGLGGVALALVLVPTGITLLRGRTPRTATLSRPWMPRRLRSVLTW